MIKFEIENFDGPLDLLLQMIEKNRLEISEISLSKISDEYMEYITRKKNIDMSEMSDFIYIASKLIKIKSYYMLNISREEVEDNDIIHSLELYAMYKKMSDKLKKIYDLPLTYYEKLPEDFLTEEKFKIDEIKIQNLKLDILYKNSNNKNKIYVKRNKKTINEKIKFIKNYIVLNKKTSFEEILEENTKEESVVSMLSALQLSNENYLVIYQKNNFDKIILEYN